MKKMEETKQELVDYFRKKAQENRSRAQFLESEAKDLRERAEKMDDEATTLLLSELKSPVA